MFSWLQFHGRRSVPTKLIIRVNFASVWYRCYRDRSDSACIGRCRCRFCLGYCLRLTRVFRHARLKLPLGQSFDPFR